MGPKSASKTSRNNKRAITWLLLRPALFPCPGSADHFYWRSSSALAAPALSGASAIDQELSANTIASRSRNVAVRHKLG